MKNVLIHGTVQKGQDRGKSLGFPTINFNLSQDIPEGIYISQIIIKNKKYNSLTFIGAAKTFNEETVHAETYVLNFNEDIYGERVSVSLLKKIRDNQKFESQKDLIKQMKEDKKQAEEFFKLIQKSKIKSFIFLYNQRLKNYLRIFLKKYY